MADFNINAALKAYLDDPQSIVTPEADAALLDCENEADAFTPGLINGVLNHIANSVGETPDAIIQQSTLDSLQFLLKQATFIPTASLSKILDLISSALGAAAEIVHHEEQDGESETAQHKQVLEALAFLMQWSIAAVDVKCAEKPTSAPARGKGVKGGKGKSAVKDGQWDPSVQLQTALDVMTKVMKLKLSKIFVTTSERDTFISLFTRPSYLILESEVRVKNTAIRMHVFKVLCVAIKHHGHAYGAQTSVIQNLTYFEHLAEPMAEFLNILAEQYDYAQLAEEVMKELSNREFSANDTKGPKSVSTFVARLSELAPRVVQRQVTCLAKLLESENYTLRCAILEVCGNLIAMLSRQEEGDRSENYKKQINAFFEVLEERFLDINPYCRSRAIQVWVKLCDLETKYPKRRQTAAELATRSLEDKSSTVRRNAMKLLGRLMATHPFAGLHGGLLSYSEWSERLQVCEPELNALQPPAGAPGLGEHTEVEATVDEGLVDDATQVDAQEQPMSEEQQVAALAKAQEEAVTADVLNKLQLTRRYYQEAIKFIATLHAASPLVMQLLGSKTKTEVTEAMDFFVISDAYHLETSKSGIKRMLRLIWTSADNDEGKRVTSHLIECYKGLFFDAPKHFTANDAANYVARNIISLTSGATPAELTSLEKLISTMMTEKMVSELVVQKLWQVYCVQKREISKQQRRGAIIIIGMLALADPNIIVQEMEACLRIGLGTIGRKDLVLARYTCIALMRMTDSKPTKGTQTTQAMPRARLPNDHAVLIRLASLLEIQTDSEDWYGMAEKAIGAIYALSKHPDVLCGEVVQRKSKAVFAVKSSLPNSQGPNTSQVDDDGDVEMSDMPSEVLPEEPSADEPPSADGSSALALSQLLFAAGHIAIKQLVHMELCEQDFKRRKEEKERTTSTSSPVKKTPGTKTPGSRKQEEDDELDLMAGTNEDDFDNALKQIRDRELLYSRQSLLSNFGPLVREICANSTAYPNAQLQAQAALCMAKFMCVSWDYCEANLDLLVSLLENSPSPTTRSNLMVALGDMVVCFNHGVEPRSASLYDRLADPALLVRRTCLMTLSHLITAMKIKVKGQMAQMAKCVEDPDLVLRDLSRTFFTDLSTKDNAIYNNFIDMFSVLSAEEGLEEDQFKKIIKFLASLIEKDKFAKQLASKLAPRLGRAESERQWNDVAFALSLLPHKNEDIAKTLAEGCKVVESAA